MKKLLLFLILIIPALANAQITTSPDTVCYQTNGSIYQVTNVPGDTYTWTVASPGVIISGQGTSTINVNWGSAAPGAINNGVSVFPTNSFGCQGPTVTMNVFIFNVVPTVTPNTFCADEPCTALVGTPVGGVWSGPGVVGNQFCPSAALVGNQTVTYTYTEAGCTFTATGVMTVNPLPIISPISHN
jgi:hypothetical protein